MTSLVTVKAVGEDLRVTFSEHTHEESTHGDTAIQRDVLSRRETIVRDGSTLDLHIWSPYQSVMVTVIAPEETCAHAAAVEYPARDDDASLADAAHDALIASAKANAAQANAGAP